MEKRYFWNSSTISSAVRCLSPPPASTYLISFPYFGINEHGHTVVSNASSTNVTLATTVSTSINNHPLGRHHTNSHLQQQPVKRYYHPNVVDHCNFNLKSYCKILI